MTPELIREDRWIPVSESGDRWAPRSLEAAQEAMAEYPAGGTYTTGEPWDGIVRIEHEVRYVTEWTTA